MKYQLIIEPEAKHDIAPIQLWYNQQQVGLGDKLIEELDRKLKGSVESLSIPSKI